jgi:uncharacterized integral membrane protein
MKRLRVILFALLLSLCVVVIAQNLETFSQSASLKLLWLVSRPVKIYILVLGAFLVGLVLSSIITISEGLRLRGEVRRKAHEIARLEQELAALRAQATAQAAAPKAPSEGRPEVPGPPS